jgi:uncharacterized protein involved in response to NO
MPFPRPLDTTAHAVSHPAVHPAVRPAMAAPVARAVALRAERPAGGPAAAPGLDSRWRPARLTTAPHRLGFFAAAVLMGTTALWWALGLWARHAGVPLPWAVPPPVAHGLAFALAFMPLFIVGFLFTAGPRWLGVPDTDARSLLRPVLAMSSGWLVALAGFHVAAALAALGIGVAAAGWIALLHRFRGLLRASPVPDRRHAQFVGLAGAVGALAMLAGAIGVGLGQTDLARVAAQLAIWGFLAPTFATVSHRMIPFFTASALPALDAWRPYWLLHAMLAVLAVSAAGAVAELLWWPLPAAVRATLLAVQAPGAMLLLWLAWRWGVVQSLRIRLLAMLHGGFVWLGLALALSALSQARMLWLGAEASLGLAPMHALTMGYLGATLIAMSTRVAAGHSGRPLAADDIAWVLYLVVQTAVLLRVGAALWPAASTPLTLLAVSAWAIGCAGWALRYGGWLGRPRVDGRPG